MESSELETNVGINKYSTEGGFIFRTLGQQAKKKTIDLFHLPTLMHNSLFINNMYVTL